MSSLYKRQSWRSGTHLCASSFVQGHIRNKHVGFHPSVGSHSLRVSSLIHKWLHDFTCSCFPASSPCSHYASDKPLAFRLCLAHKCLVDLCACWSSCLEHPRSFPWLTTSILLTPYSQRWLLGHSVWNKLMTVCPPSFQLKCQISPSTLAFWNQILKHTLDC